MIGWLTANNLHENNLRAISLVDKFEITREALSIKAVIDWPHRMMWSVAS